MPLQKGQSKKVLEKNFHELRLGPQYQKTLSKFGRSKANQQMVAVALEQRRKSR